MKIDLNRKNVSKIILGAFLMAGMGIGHAQEDKAKGVLNTTTTEKMSYVDTNGTAIPFTITTQENRVYTAKFTQSDENPENFDRKETPALVSKMITVESEMDKSLNRIIVLRYEKELSDTFELVSTDKGFAVEVDGKSMNYIFGKGIYFADTADKDFFIVDEFDVLM